MNLLRALALAGALSSIAVAPAFAQAEPSDMRSGRFVVELKGVQETTWKTRHAAQFECDVNIDGGGFENVWFRSKGTVLKVSSFGRTVLMRRGRAPASLDLRAKVERQGVVETTSGAVCADGDGDAGPPPLADCGTKRSRLRVDVSYRRGRVSVEPDLVIPRDPFANCPQGGISWPSLLTRSRKGRLIGQALPMADLFDHGRNIVVARGRETQDDGESQSTTTIRWSLSFKRIKEEEEGR
jgi:hypothetical protein